jgi:hypothetical protein
MNAATPISHPKVKLKRRVKEMELFADPDLHEQLQKALRDKAVLDGNVKAKDVEVLRCEDELAAKDLEVSQHVCLGGVAPPAIGMLVSSSIYQQTFVFYAVPQVQKRGEEAT